MRQNPVWELTTSVSLILSGFPSAGLGFASYSAPAHGWIVGIGVQSTKSAKLLSVIMCRPQIGQLS